MVQDRRDSKHERCWKGGIEECRKRRDEGKEG